MPGGRTSRLPTKRPPNDRQPPPTDVLKIVSNASSIAYLLVLALMLAVLCVVDIYMLPQFMKLFEGMKVPPLAIQVLLDYRIWIRAGVLLLFTGLVALSLVLRAPYVHLLRWVLTPILIGILIGGIVVSFYTVIFTMPTTLG